MILKYEDLLKIVLFTLFLVFALSFSIFPILAEFFTLLKWVMLALFILLSFLLSKKTKLQKNYSVLFYFGFVCIILISSIFKSGFTFKILEYAFPFIFVLVFYFLPKFSLRKSNAQFVIDEFLIFSKLIFITFIPLIFFNQFYIMGRFSGWLQNTNIVAGLATLSIILIFYNILIEKKKNYKELSFLFLFLIILLLTQSRGGLVSSIVGCILIFLSNLKSIKSFIESTIILIIVVIVLILLINNSSFSEMITFRDLELGIRGEMIDRQLNAFASNPIIGVGVVENEDDPTARLHSETSYTDILSMGGIIGSLFLIIAFIIRIKNLDKKSLFAFLTILVMSFSEGYITGIGGIISLVFYLIFISGK